MESGVAALVLVAAALHAAWNTQVKRSRDPLLALATVIVTAGALGALLLPWVGLPPADAWPYLGASVLLHGLYHLLLARSYRLGDLSQVYPIARGVAPPLVAGLAALSAGELPGPLPLAGLVIASLSIASLGMGGSPSQRGAVGFALATGTLIAAYSVVDGHGSRSAGALSFIAWSHVLDVPPICAVAGLSRRGQIRAHLERDGLRAAAGGVIAISTYSIVLWAMTRAPLASVSMLRETSVIFAGLFGALLLRERVGPRRVVATLGVCAGGALLLGG